MNDNVKLEEIDFTMSPSGIKPNSAEREQNYIVPESQHLGSLESSHFNHGPVSFTMDRDHTLIIKEHKSGEPLSNRHLVNLKHLHSRFISTHTEPKIEPSSLWKRIYSSLEGIISSLKRKPKQLRIKKAIVNFNKCSEVSDEGIKSVVTLLMSFYNIEHLEFEVNNTSATDESVAVLSSLLNRYTHLSYFYIDFSGCRVSDDGIFILANALKGRNTLQEVWLRFSWCAMNKITNEGVSKICKGIEDYRDLRVLLLEFNGHSEISNKGLSAIFTCIKKMSTLRKLYVYFERSQTTDNFLIYAGEILSRLKRLQVFGINLGGSSYVSLKGIEKLEQGLRSLGSLRDGLYLYLNGCLGVFEREKARKSFDAIVKKRKIKNYVLEFE